MDLKIVPGLLGRGSCIPGSDIGDETTGTLEYHLADVDELLARGRCICGMRHKGIVVYFCPDLVDWLVSVVAKIGRVGSFRIKYLRRDLSVLTVELFKDLRDSLVNGSCERMSDLI